MTLLKSLISLSVIAIVAINSISDRNCQDKGSLSFTSEDGVLKLNGERFNLKGLSWFGFETTNYVVHGLWCQDYHTLIDFIANNSFNAMRLPFSCELVLNDYPPQTIDYNDMNEDLFNLTSLQVMDKIISAAGDAGIMVMLDMHSLEAGGYMQDGLWYDDKYAPNTTQSCWNTMINRYKDFWNIIAVDVFNEPFSGTWCTGDKSTDFNTWCETIGNDVLSKTDWLILCEGVAKSPPCADPCFWGEDLQGVKTCPVILNTPNKIVYSPHVYGSSVASQPYFNVNNFPNNMPAIWNEHWGFIKNMSKSALTVGEWGGQYSGNDGEWMDEFVTYLIEIDAPDTYFWCLNPDSGDTGGLLENDWQTPVTPKLELLDKLQPNPTKITPQSDTNVVCIN